MSSTKKRTAESAVEPKTKKAKPSTDTRQDKRIKKAELALQTLQDEKAMQIAAKCAASDKAAKAASEVVGSTVAVASPVAAPPGNKPQWVQPRGKGNASAVPGPCRPLDCK